MKQISVTKTFLPPLKEFQAYLERIWESEQLTNQGPLLIELEQKLNDYFQIPYTHVVANGTLALQLALRSLDITEGEVITTPFTYVATTSAILWEHCRPVYVDIDPLTLNLDPKLLEAAITTKTRAILPVHVFGVPCDVEAIETIAKKHSLPVIYDSAHAFGVSYLGKPLLSYGDLATCSFHATKLFHTIEGGAVVTHDRTKSDKLELLKRFGHQGDTHKLLGINAKTSEFHAAMGLANLRYTSEIIDARREISELYDTYLMGDVDRPKIPEGTIYNFAYYPVLLKDELQVKKVLDRLAKNQVFPRRYFYPSLNRLPYLDGPIQKCTVSEDVARRILCLPLYVGLTKDEIVMITQELRRAL